MRRFFVVVGLMLLLSLSVAGQKKRELTTPVSVSYSLPKVSYEVVVRMECTRLVPGPLREYAQERLGKRAEITSVGEEWRIKDICVVPRAVPDTKAMYSLNASGEYNSILIHLTPEGFLAGVGSGGTNEEREERLVYTAEGKVPEEEVDYVRFGMRSTLKEVLDSNFTEMEVEGEIRKVWDPIERHVLKEEKDYAAEVTEDIFNIRRRRLELLTTGGATAEGLKALEELEANYVSLFMGKRVTREVERRFSFLPEKADESVVLFRFSESEGVTSKNNVAAIPYIIELQNVVVPRKEGPQGGAPRPVSAVFYREPAVADLCLLRGKDKVMSVRCVIPQLGYIKQFPLDVINNEGIAIEFYPGYGSLKGVLKK